MLHHKLIVVEHPGTNLITNLVNEEALLTIANQIAYQKRAKNNLRLEPMPYLNHRQQNMKSKPQTNLNRKSTI